MAQTPTYFIELFDIVPENLPSLYAYGLSVRGSGDHVRLGRRLAVRLMRAFDGHWVWSDDVIVTDNPQSQNALDQAIHNIRSRQPDIVKDFARIVSVDGWTASVRAQADFVAYGLISDLGGEMKAALQPPIDLDGMATVERDFEVRGWVVYGRPVVSISVESSVIFKEDLKSYLKRLKSEDEILGLFVADKVPSANGTVVKGEIVSIAGRLDRDITRQELLAMAQREGSAEIITKAREGELVVHVGHNEYQYVVSALRIIVFTKYYKRFGIDSKKAQNATWITPSERASLVSKLSAIVRPRKFLGNTYASDHESARFVGSSTYHYDPTIIVGNGQRVEYKGGSALLSAIDRFGLYQRTSDTGNAHSPLNVGVVNSSNFDFSQAQEALQEQLSRLGFVNADFRIQPSGGATRLDFERAINALRSFEPHILVALIPDADSLDEDEWGPYYDFKSLMMQIDLPSQVLDVSKLRKVKNLAFMMQNVALGMSSKMGNVPYILANSLDYADIVVGIDIARKRNKRGSGTQNAAAIAQVYHQGGQFDQCRVVETPLDGETVPGNVLRSLFPLDKFENKRVIIHRDGPFRGDEVAIMDEHITQLNGQAYFVEVIKSGAPRLYQRVNRQIVAPGIGTAFLLSDAEAFLIASESSTATPQPLQIRTRAPFTIGKALHSVLMLTLMHYGSLRRPRAPITIHFSDRIGYLALRGVKPAGGTSTDMYWL